MSLMKDQALKFAEYVTKADPDILTTQELEALDWLALAILNKVREVRQMQAKRLNEERGWKQ